MRIVKGLESIDPPLEGSVLAIGNFDGVNRAHQHLIAQGAIFAIDTGLPLVVITFDPHPLAILAPSRVPPRLTTNEERARLLGQAGADSVVIAEANAELLSIEAEAFIRDIVVPRFRPKHIVEGPNFGFGKGRRGTNDTLERLGSELDFSVCVVEPLEFCVEGNARPVYVSSTLCRRFLSEGKVRHAALCLGRNYALTGTVVRGPQVGRSLGFPTANLDPDDLLIPAEGVYAGRTVVDDGRVCAAAISIGTKQTFDGKALSIEAHLLDFAGDLYGRRIRLEFAFWLRGQQRFPSADALSRQLGRDVARVRELLPDPSEGIATDIPESRHANQ